MSQRPRRFGLLAIENAAYRYRWVTPLLCVIGAALVVLALMDAAT